MEYSDLPALSGVRHCFFNLVVLLLKETSFREEDMEPTSSQVYGRNDQVVIKTSSNIRLSLLSWEEMIKKQSGLKIHHSIVIRLLVVKML